MSIEIREVKSRKELRTFIFMPRQIHKNDFSWLPPIWLDEKELFNKEKNNSYRYNDTIMLLAYRDKKPVGRIMGIISHRYNEINNEKHARLCFVECEEDKEVFHALVTALEEWARGRDMEAMIGPLGFSDKDPEGFQIEGFEYPQVITTATNYPYMPSLIEGEGYVKKKDIVNYHVKVPESIPAIYQKIFARANQRADIKIVEFRKKRELKPYIIDILELMNDTFKEIYGFVPLTDPEKLELASRYLPLLTPAFVKVVTNGTKPIAFAIAMPDISEGIRKSGGHLFPFGIVHILRASKRSKKLVMLLGGIRSEYRSQGIDSLLGAKMFESAIKRKMKIIDSHLVLEENLPMRGEYERLGGEIVKKFRIYTKKL